MKQSLSNGFNSAIANQATPFLSKFTPRDEQLNASEFDHGSIFKVKNFWSASKVGQLLLGDNLQRRDDVNDDYDVTDDVKDDIKKDNVGFLKQSK